MSVPNGYRRLDPLAKYYFRDSASGSPKWEAAGPQHQVNCFDTSPLAITHVITEEESLQFSEAIARELGVSLGIKGSGIAFTSAISKTLGIEFKKGRAAQNETTIAPVRCFTVFAEPWELRQDHEIEVLRENSNWWLRKGWEPIGTIKYYNVIRVKWKNTYEYDINSCPIEDSEPIVGTVPSTKREVPGELWYHPVMNDLTVMLPLRKDKSGNPIPLDQLIPDELEDIMKKASLKEMRAVTRSVMRRGVPIPQHLLDSRWKQSWKELNQVLSSRTVEEVLKIAGMFLRIIIV